MSSPQGMPDGGERGRILTVDAARGLMILLMVGYHLLYDLVFFMGAPSALILNPVLRLAQPVGAGIFILLSGATSRTSKSNLRRALRIGAAAVLVSLVTFLFDRGAFVRFGILHFLAAASFLYALARPVVSRIPTRVQPFLYAALYIVSSFMGDVSLPAHWPVPLRSVLWALGFSRGMYVSTDFFPVFPWIFVFLFGTWFGGLLFAGKCPQWVYVRKPHRMAAVGRQSFLIYLLHQPLLMGLMYLLTFLRGA